MKDYAEYDALGLAELVRTKQVTPDELLTEARKRAETVQAELNCFSNMFEGAGEAQIRAGLEDGPFTGVPYPIKDLGISLKDWPMTNGSVAWKDNIEPQDSVLAERYKAAGLVLFAQTTSPEWGLTTSTESQLYGQTRNPWDVSRTSGGSSGGASAVVASGVVPAAHASDGGGSIRIPAACTGLFGLKPSRGRTPMGPWTTEGWNGQSCHHAVSRTVRDSAALLDVSHGAESGSRYVAPQPSGPYLSAAHRDPGKLKVAVWAKAPNGTEGDAEAKAGIANTVKLMESLGHVVEEASPDVDGEALGKSLMMTVSAAMAMTVAARGDARGRPVEPEELEMVTNRFVEFGNQIPMIELMRANQASIHAGLAFDRFMEAGGYDVILAPTLARAPEKLGVLSLSPENVDDYGVAVTTFAPWCAFFNQIGAPAMSVPLHWTAETLPIGMMFGARCGEEELLFSLAGQLEKAAPWAHRRPPVWVG
ncbi:MAG: amidase [Pseudomonadota bacterium]